MDSPITRAEHEEFCKRIDAENNQTSRGADQAGHRNCSFSERTCTKHKADGRDPERTRRKTREA